MSSTEPSHPWLAAVLDFMMRPLYPARRLVIPEARGAVLEDPAGIADVRASLRVE